MLCPHCGNETPENQRFCQNCGKPLTTEKSSNKKYVLIISFLAFLLIIIVSAILYVSLKDSVRYIDKSINSTTKPTEKNIDYKSETLKEMTYCYNSEWKIENYNSGDVYNHNNGSKFVVEYNTFDRRATYDDVKEDVDGIEELNADDELILIETESNIDFNFDNIETYYFSGNYTDDSENDWYYDYYAFIQDDTIFTMIFNGIIYNYKDEFDESKDYILKHISFSEPMTEEPTTEEPTTEKPTEPPTEKPTDITEPMTLLYDDSEISVYFSDIEPSYYDNEVDVHLFIDNKMNKQIRISSDVVILDGISYNDTVCEDLISANTRGIVEISVDKCSNISPSTFGADLKYYPTENFEDRVYLNIISKSIK